MLTAGSAPPLRVALLTTRRAPGLDHLIGRALGRGARWRLVSVVASDPACEELERLAQGGIPSRVHDLSAFCRARGARSGDLEARSAYDRVTVDLLREVEADVVALCGYLHVVTAPLLEAFPGRLLNLHDSDLLQRAMDGRTRYPGLHAVRDALAAGEAETRSTLHLVTAEVDEGPALFRSWAFPVPPLVREALAWGATDIFKAYAYAHRGWMMRASWGPLLARALDGFADGEVRHRDGRYWIGGWTAPLDLAPPIVRRLRRA